MSDLVKASMNDHETTDHEVQVLEAVARSVQARYPSIPADAVAARMHGIHHRYVNARIRDFVPLLVERQLIAELRSIPDAGQAPA